MRILIAFALALFALPALACGGPDDACETPLGSYFAVKPAGDDIARPAVVFFHGGWGSRIHKMRKWMTDAFTGRGYVVIGTNGSKRPGSKWGPGWAFIPQFAPHRDEVAFTRQVLDDAEARFNIDRSRVLGRFSIKLNQFARKPRQKPSTKIAHSNQSGNPD